MKTFTVSVRDGKEYLFFRVEGTDLWDAMMRVSKHINYRVHWAMMSGFPEEIVQAI